MIISALISNFRFADYPDRGDSKAFLATVQSDLHELV